ncbi:MAG: hypothetical protein HC876_20015 [Chloroflexaceae bacterium]|nr:hypothetical protein [Chloroflexaceae bacterium]
MFASVVLNRACFPHGRRGHCRRFARATARRHTHRQRPAADQEAAAGDELLGQFDARNRAEVGGGRACAANPLMPAGHRWREHDG